MCIEYLHLAENGMQNDYAGCSFTNEPVTRCNIHWLPIQRIWMYGCCDDRVACKYSQSCA